MIDVLDVCLEFLCFSRICLCLVQRSDPQHNHAYPDHPIGKAYALPSLSPFQTPSAHPSVHTPPRRLYLSPCLRVGFCFLPFRFSQSKARRRKIRTACICLLKGARSRLGPFSRLLSWPDHVWGIDSTEAKTWKPGHMNRSSIRAGLEMENTSSTLDGWQGRQA